MIDHRWNANPYACPDCGADRNTPDADCAACDYQAPDYTPQEDGPDAADLWELERAERRAGRLERVVDLAARATGALVLGLALALVLVSPFLDWPAVDRLIVTWKAEAWAWFLGAL